MELENVTSKIAFDLDGVLVPDYSHIPNLSHQQFYEYTLYAKPLINPSSKFDIVTARSEQYRDITEKWLTIFSKTLSITIAVILLFPSEN